MVGYRDEERPNLFDSHQRTELPYFAVHALAEGSPAPKKLVIKDYSKKTQEQESVPVSSFDWEHGARPSPLRRADPWPKFVVLKSSSPSPLTPNRTLENPSKLPSRARTTSLTKKCGTCAKKAEFLSIALPSAVGAFFAYYEDLDRSTHEKVVEKGVSETFLQFKKKVTELQKRVSEMEAEPIQDLPRE
eukprot:scaffold1953_cov176-Amphora_coffeaeformis.AAC.35